MIPFGQEGMTKEQNGRRHCASGQLQMRMDERGLTLVELMVVIVLVAILAYFVGPELTSWGPKSRLKSQNDQLFAAMQQAKVYALKNNTNVTFTFTYGSPCPGGSYDFRDGAANLVVNATMDGGVCLSAGANAYQTGDGFDFRGLPLQIAVGNWPRRVTLTHADVGSQYDIDLTVAGGISVDKH